MKDRYITPRQKVYILYTNHQVLADSGQGKLDPEKPGSESDTGGAINEEQTFSYNVWNEEW